MQLTMTSSPCKKKVAAFTFIEILVTVSVMVISLSIGVANYLRFLDKQKLYQSGSSIEVILKDARSKAQNGFLGNSELGFCAQLKAVEVSSGLTADNEISITAQLHCASDHILVYDSYVIEEQATILNKNFQAAYLPIHGAVLLFNGAASASGSAVLSRGTSSVIFGLDQGGVIDVKYQ